MSVIERSVRQPVLVSVVVMLVVLFGSIGLFSVPVQLTPNVDQPQVQVTTRWFGASPLEIEQEILKEQEEVLKNVDGLKEMRSTATEGEGKVSLKFRVGKDKEAILNEVRDKLRLVKEYPADVDEPIAESVDSSQSDFIAWMLLRKSPGVTSPKFDSTYRGSIIELQDFTEKYIEPVLERAEGVAEVNVLGGREREMQVRVDMAKLAARGITVDQLVDAIRNENDDTSAGVLLAGKTETSIRTVGRYEDPAELRNTVIAYDPASSPIYIRDVADVVLDFKRQRGFVRSLGEEVIALNAKRRAGSNVLEVMANLQQQIKRVNEEVLAPRGWGVELVQVYDQTIYVDDAVATVTSDLITGAILASLVLFLTLRSFGATMVVAVSIPISVVGTFLGMQLFGRNLNVISMAGLSFAIGMGVDNTIVVLENIFRHREMGKDRIAAAIDGTSEVWGAIVAATLANMAVFLPVVFIQEEAGQLFKDISIAICVSLFFYMVVSPTVIPMLATLFLRRMPSGLKESKDDTQTGRLTAPIGRLERALSQSFYVLIFWLTGGTLRRIVTIWVLLAGSVTASVLLRPESTYLPQGNQNLVFGIASVPPGYSLDELNRIGLHVESTLRPWWEAKEGSPEHRALQAAYVQETQARVKTIQDTLATMEKTMPAEAFAAASQFLQYQLFGLMGPPPPTIDNFFFVSFQGQVFMGAISNDRQNIDPLVGLFGRAWEGVPAAQPFAFKLPLFNLGGDFDGGIELLITANDYASVLQAATAVKGGIMANNIFPRSTPGNFDLGQPELRIRPDRERAAASAVTPAALRSTAEVAVDGLIVGDYRFEGRDIDLTVVAAGRDTRDEGELPMTPVATRDGRIVPLSSVALFERTTAAQTILRVEEQPSVSFSIAVPANKTVQEVQQTLTAGIIDPLRQSGAIPPTVGVKMEGSAAKLDDFLAAFYPGFILAAVITYLLLAALFESWIYPLVIVLSVPFALVGGFIGLFVLRLFDWSAQLDVLTMLGFVILIGTIVNNPILIVHQALNYLAQGKSRREAIALSTQTRVRPIFMSVIVSVAGMAPLVLGGAAGSELYRPLGAVVIGGLLLSTVFTLFLTPTLMSLLLDFADWLGRLFGRQPLPAPLGAQTHSSPPSSTPAI